MDALSDVELMSRLAAAGARRRIARAHAVPDGDRPAADHGRDDHLGGEVSSK
jgi:hypothetical protein